MKGPRKRKSLKSMNKVIIVMEGTVEARGKSGGVQYTQKECCEIVEHYNNGGVAAMTRSGAQVDTSCWTKSYPGFRLNTCLYETHRYGLFWNSGGTREDKHIIV